VGGGVVECEDCPPPPQAVHAKIKIKATRTGSARRCDVLLFPFFEALLFGALRENPLRKRQPNTALLPASIHKFSSPRIAGFGLRELVAEAAVTVSVTTAGPFTLTDVGDKLQPRLLADVVHERLTVPLNPETDPRLMMALAEFPFGTTNWGTAGAIVKSGVIPASTALRIIGTLTDSW
jgi:hypothetical protein